MLTRAAHWTSDPIAVSSLSSYLSALKHRISHFLSISTWRVCVQNSFHFLMFVFPSISQNNCIQINDIFCQFRSEVGLSVLLPKNLIWPLTSTGKRNWAEFLWVYRITHSLLSRVYDTMTNAHTIVRFHRSTTKPYIQIFLNIYCDFKRKREN